MSYKKEIQEIIDKLNLPNLIMGKHKKVTKKELKKALKYRDELIEEYFIKPFNKKMEKAGEDIRISKRKK